MKCLFLILILSSQIVFSHEYSRENFCQIRQNKNNFLEFSRRRENLLSFSNNGGLLGMGTGTCWWHSRLQRRFLYLAHFLPQYPKPKIEDIKTILFKIKNGTEVVDIPGYTNLEEFSYEHKDLIQKILNNWMLKETLIGFQWAKGLKGKSHLADAVYMKSYLNKMYDDFIKENGMQLQILQMKGMKAHSWLVIDIAKTADNEFVLETIDSNLPAGSLRYKVNTDRTSINSVDNYLGYEPFISYTYYNKELQNLKHAVEEFCHQ